MPNFVNEVHNVIIENYLRKGTLRHKDQSFSIYYNDSQGFINEGGLKTGNFFNHKDVDYIMSASLQRISQGKELIVLDSKGKIEGIS